MYAKDLYKQILKLLPKTKHDILLTLVLGIFTKIFFGYMNWKILSLYYFFRNATHGKTLESQYKQQFYTTYKTQT